MDLLGTLAELQDIATKLKVAKVYICGGTPRDLLLDEKDNIDDIDITNGDASIHQLAEAFGKIIMERGGDYRVLKDGHAQIQFEGIKIDFSSNYMVPGIKEMLLKVGAKPTDMLMEMYSRDFTCNALLVDTGLKSITDPTGLGINDIKKERIRTCLPANITLGVDNKRVIRVIYLAAKLGFSVDPEIIEWIKGNPKSISNVKPKYLATKLQKACDYDLSKTVSLLNEMNLWGEIPILQDLQPYASKGLVSHVQE